KMIAPFLMIFGVVAMYAFIIWGLEGKYRKIETIEGLTSREKRALRGQIWAIIPFSAFLVAVQIFYYGSVTDWNFFQFHRLLFILIAMPFTFIGLSSIINRVSLFVPRGSGMELTKGSSAMFAGSFILFVVTAMTLCNIYGP